MFYTDNKKNTYLVYVTKKNIIKGHSLIIIGTAFNEREKYAEGSEWQVRNENLEEVAENLFKIGDNVLSKVGPLSGVVTAFEKQTNRVVVMSHKNENHKDKRVRFAYKIDEILKKEDFIVLKPGCVYKINKSINLLAVQSVFQDDQVMLVNFSGNVEYSNIPKESSSAMLEHAFGISTVEFRATSISGILGA